jgi:hypothetical protein
MITWFITEPIISPNRSLSPLYYSYNFNTRFLYNYKWKFIPKKLEYS